MKLSGDISLFSLNSKFFLSKCRTWNAVTIPRRRSIFHVPPPITATSRRANGIPATVNKIQANRRPAPPPALWLRNTKRASIAPTLRIPKSVHNYYNNSRNQQQQRSPLVTLASGEDDSEFEFSESAFFK